MGMDGNDIADELASHGSSHALIGCVPALSICAQAVRGVVREWTGRKHEEHW
jgi:hypothetical protein